MTETVHTLQKGAFDYFKKLLLSALVVKRQLTVREELEGVDYVSLTGTTTGLTRGRDFTSLSPCYVRFVKLVAPQDAAERRCHYMTTNIVLNTEQDITIEIGTGRVIETNNALPFLPCLKHKKRVPTVLSVINIKVCAIFKNAVNLTTPTALYAATKMSSLHILQS